MRVVEDGSVGDRRALVKATTFVLKAVGHPSSEIFELEDLVTPESLPDWDLAATASALRGLGIHTRVEYLSEEWSMVPLVPTSGKRPYASHGTARATQAIYLRYDEGSEDWFVHVLDEPGISIESLA
jgi:hypothetical protein